MPIVRKPRPQAAGSTERRRALRRLLDDRDHAGIAIWLADEPHAVRTLFAALFDTDARRRWRAMEALGRLAGSTARHNPERVRDWIRRILWNMMEESGGLMWHGPEAIGEILAHAPSLIPEYLGPLGSFRREEPFEAGTYTALARIAPLAPAALATIAPVLLPGLADPDPRIRAHAALALGSIGHDAAWSGIAALKDDDSRVTVYDRESGELRTVTVGEIARSVRS